MNKSKSSWAVLRQRRVASLLAMSALAVAGRGAAQGTQSESGASAEAEAGLSEIVVTAQFHGEKLQNTPIAITAVNAEMMDARNQKSLIDVASAAPNVNIRPSTSALGNAASIFIRGVGQYDPSFALEPGVGIYIDDVYFPTIYGSVFDLLDLDRVEILRGPQGTLAGKNSIGGAIKLYSKKPDADPDAFVEAGYGNYNQLNFRAGGNFTLIPGQLYARLSGVYKRRDGYMDRVDYGCANPGSGVKPNPIQESCQIGTEGGQEFGGARVALRWLPTEKLEANISADYSVDNGEPSPTKLVYALPATGLQQYITNVKYRNYSTYQDPNNGFVVPPVNRIASTGAAANVTYAFTDTLSLTSITAYRRYEGQSGIDADGTPLGIQDIYSPVTFREYTEEDRVSGQWNKLDYTAGIYYYNGHGYSGGRVDASTVDFLTGDTAVSSSESGFIHTVYHVTDPFSVSLGLRYTHEKKDFTYSSLDPANPSLPAPLVGAINGLQGHYSGSRMDYRANATYQWTPDFMTYATFSTGFKGGGVNPRPFDASQVVPFGQEKIQAYELGAKTEWFDHKVRLNLAAFYNDYKDIQLTITNGYGDFFLSAIPLNAGTAHVKGVELEGELHPVDGLEMDFAASYLNFKYVSLTADAVTSGINFNMSTPFTPSTEFNAGIQYELPIHVAGGGIIPRLDVNYQSHFYTNAANGPLNDTEGRTLVNGRLTWKSDAGKWEAAFSGTNLLNKYYYATTFDIVAQAGIATASPAPPRLWMISLKHHF